MYNFGNNSFVSNSFVLIMDRSLCSWTVFELHYKTTFNYWLYTNNTTTTNTYDFARIIKPMRRLDNILITWPCTHFISFVLVRRHLNIPLWNSRSLLIKWLVYYFHTFNFCFLLGLDPLGSLNHNNFISLCVCMINYIFYLSNNNSNNINYGHFIYLLFSLCIIYLLLYFMGRMYLLLCVCYCVHYHYYRFVRICNFISRLCFC